MLLVEVLLELYEDFPNAGGITQFMNCIVYAAILELKKALQPLRLQFAHSSLDVLSEDEVEERLLLIIVMGKDQVLVFYYTFLSGLGS